MTSASLPQMDSMAARGLLEMRDRMTNALSLFRPTVAQEKFFRAMPADQLLEIAVTGRNRGGKSLAVAVWFASMVLDEPVTMRNGEKLYMRPRRWAGEAMLCWAVGYDWRHIGETMYRLLFKPDLFRIIRDKKTREWRSYDPTNPDDKGRKSETKPSPPLIRHSDVIEDSWSWENKKDKQLSSVQLKKDGTRIVFYASTGEVAAGNPVHVIWVDEQISSASHYPEWLMRLVDHDGRIVWSSWPALDASGAFDAVLERAKEEQDSPAPRRISFQFRKGDNPYTENETLDAALAAMSDEEAAARGDGDSGRGRWLMYQLFNINQHRVLGPMPESDDDLAKAVREAGGIPHDWTRYLVLDPGTANCAVLFVAVPPPALGDFVVPYDELYLHHRPAKDVAELIAAKTNAGRKDAIQFEDFIIDSHAARVTPMNFDGTIGQNIEKEFTKAGVICRRRGAAFSFGSDNIETRIMRLQGMMEIGRSGYPRLRVLTLPIPGTHDVKPTCPVLCDQLMRYRRKKDPLGNPTDKPADYQKIDMAVCAEYFASRDDLIYVPAKTPRPLDKTDHKEVVGFLMKQFGIRPTSAEPSIYCGAGAAP